MLEPDGKFELCLAVHRLNQTENLELLSIAYDVRACTSTFRSSTPILNCLHLWFVGIAAAPDKNCLHLQAAMERAERLEEPKVVVVAGSDIAVVVAVIAVVAAAAGLYCHCCCY